MRDILFRSIPHGDHVEPGNLDGALSAISFRPVTRSSRDGATAIRAYIRNQEKDDQRLDGYQALGHTTWQCKYHVVFIPKCRRKTLYLELRRHLGEVFRKLAEQKESKIA